MIAYSDFDAPLNSSNPRDSSASAIVASAAIELYAITGQDKYLDAATSILDSLTGPDYSSEGTQYESILRKASEKWGRPEVAAVFADYFFVEAELRYLALFPLDTTAGKLINISTRGFVSTGDKALIGGFVIGNETQQVLIQAIGPELADNGVAETLNDPLLQIFDAGKQLIMSNDNWEDSQKQLITDLWDGSPPLSSGISTQIVV